jgi:hypothetical protein
MSILTLWAYFLSISWTRLPVFSLTMDIVHIELSDITIFHFFLTNIYHFTK